MKKFKKFLSVLTAAMVMAVTVVPASAFAKTYDATAQLYATVTDAGEVVDRIVINYGNGTVMPEKSDITKDTYTVTAKSVISAGSTKGNTYYEGEREVEKVEVSGSKVTLYLNQNDGKGATLCYVAEARNVPGELTYTITQKDGTEIKAEAQDRRTLEPITGSNITCDNSVIDAETAKFKAVDAAIDYQLYVPEGGADTLIVWYHGNGEGDIEGTTGNNVAQMLANRGTVAWATDEAQSIFGKAAVMAFQAPDMWYLATAKGYLETTYNEIQDVVKAQGIKKIIVSGCSAGGFMTTRMIIAYPDLFDAAMINCPALDVADARSGLTGATPSDKELASIKDSRTAIWLVQGATDSSVAPDACSRRLFKALTDGEKLTETKVPGTAGIASGFTTYETADGKYKLSLYDTVDTEEKEGTLGDTRPMGKLVFAEDYNQDGTLEEVKYSDHWSWIYTLRNNPQDANGTHIWQWAAKADYNESEETSVAAQLCATVTDAGEVVDRIYMEFNAPVTGVTADTFTVEAKSVISAGSTKGDTYYEGERKVEKVETFGNAIVLYLNQNDGKGATLCYVTEARNVPGELTYTIKANDTVKIGGKDKAVTVTCDNSVFNEETSKFMSFDSDIDFQLYVPQGGAENLIVWYHGNGEGDIEGTTGNNVAQMLANRGTVAWATDEAQGIFGNTAVMAFQAPDMWYLATTKGYLETTYNEIQAVVKELGTKHISVSGCSAGGFMTTRMIIAYPDLFDAAMINCPALDVADARSGIEGATPSDEELASIKNSRTAIWLVQGATDSSVAPDACSKRLFNTLTAGQKLTETKVKGTAGIASGFTTYETADGKYKLSLYDTVDTEEKEGTLGDTRLMGKLVFAEDYDQDGKLEEVKYSDHWSWIYTLRNNPQAADGTHIWQWAASKMGQQTDTPAPKPPVDTPETPAKAPAKAAKITSAAVTAKGVELKWTAVKDAESYKVYRNGKLIATLADTTAFMDYTAVTNGKKYEYKVVGMNKAGVGPKSEKATVVFLSGVKIISAENTKGKKVVVTYGQNTKASGYEIKYGTQTLTVKSNKTLKKTLKGLKLNSTCKIKVRAYKNVNGAKCYTPWSASVSVKVVK